MMSLTGTKQIDDMCAYDAAGRMVKEGARTYRYGYLDKVLSVTEGKERRTFAYHADGQLATATRHPAAGTGRAASPLAAETETFLWDGLALIQRGGTSYVNEPHPNGGSPILSSKNGIMFNDILGTTIGTDGKDGYDPAVSTAFGDSIDKNTFFTGKPHVDGLGYAFLFRDYRPTLGKWQTADPLGYPDGWNQLAYCGNMACSAIDFMGGWVKVINEYDSESWTETTDLGTHVHDGHTCHIYRIDIVVNHYIINQNMKSVRRWTSIDGLEDLLAGCGYGLAINAGIATLTGVGSIPASGLVIGGVLCEVASAIVDALNDYIDIPDGAPFEIKNRKVIDTSYLHVYE